MLLTPPKHIHLKELLQASAPHSLLKDFLLHSNACRLINLSTATRPHHRPDRENNNLRLSLLHAPPLAQFTISVFNALVQGHPKKLRVAKHRICFWQRSCAHRSFYSSPIHRSMSSRKPSAAMALADQNHSRRNKYARPLTEAEKERLEEFQDSIHYSAR